MLRKFFISLSQSESARNFITRFGPARRAARRFVAGETLDEAVAVVRALNARGIKGLLNEVGESVTTPEEANQAAQAFHHLLHRIHAESWMPLSRSNRPILACPLARIFTMKTWPESWKRPGS